MISLISSGAKEIRRNAIVSDDMVRAIEVWERMYRGEVPWRTPDKRDWLNLPSKIANEIATKVTNEAVIRIQPSEEANAADGITQKTGLRNFNKKEKKKEQTSGFETGLILLQETRFYWK